MKTISKALLAISILIGATSNGLASENLKIAVECPDVILSWESADDETYIVQYRPTLSTNTPWETLTNSLPAATGTNVTFFVHSNQMECANQSLMNSPMPGVRNYSPALREA